VEAVRAHARKADFKPLTVGQVSQLIKKNWAWTGTYFANASHIPPHTFDNMKATSLRSEACAC
jgi:hypothetical protein